MGKYDVTYVSDSAHPKPSKPLWYYNLNFKSREGDEEFTLTPNAFINYKGNEGLMANPDAKHYWNYDIFTYISALADPGKNKDTSTFQPHILKPGDSVFYSRGFITLEGVKMRDSVPEDISKIFGEDGGLYEATFKLHSQTGSIYTTTALLAVVKTDMIAVPDTIPSENIVLQLQKINEDNTVEVGVKESDSVMQWLTLKAYKFPFINLLWAGIIITAVGIIMSMVRRIQLNRRGEKS
jgi:cytochrome c-type biogenesis protein CcmF